MVYLISVSFLYFFYPKTQNKSFEISVNFRWKLGYFTMIRRWLSGKISSYLLGLGSHDEKHDLVQCKSNLMNLCKQLKSIIAIDHCTHKTKTNFYYHCGTLCKNWNQLILNYKHLPYFYILHLQSLSWRLPCQSTRKWIFFFERKFVYIKKNFFFLKRHTQGFQTTKSESWLAVLVSIACK